MPPKKRSARKMKGRGISDVLKKLHDFAKKNRLASRALGHLGYSKGAKAVHALGYGRRRRRTVRRRRMGGSGFFGDLWSGIKSAANYVKDNKLLSKGLSLIPHPAAKTASGVASALGLGRRRRVGRPRMRGGRMMTTAGSSLVF